MRPSEIKILQGQHWERILPVVPMILVGMGTCGIGNGAGAVYARIMRQISEDGIECKLKQTGCFGFCAEEPVVMLYRPGAPMLVYSKVNEKDAARIVESIGKDRIYRNKLLCRIDRWDFLTSTVEFGQGYEELPHWDEIPFFKGQQKVVLRHAGLIDPEEILDYIAVGGYHALARVLSTVEPADVVNEVIESKLRGRGGAGFPTGVKWDIMQKQESGQKYIICNADEGDPGAYMNRNEIESDPHMLIEGMLIGAYAMGADSGIAYVRAEYPLAVKRLKKAIRQAEELGLLGENILGSGLNFRLDVVEGAGAFVCGEETALIASIEGKAGRPTPRPPYPASRGLYGKPTNINNVETWCNVPVIMEKGSAWFKAIGTEKSAGTKVFSLVGKVKNTGLVELPLGSRLEQFIFAIGEGMGTSKRVKAVQTGGPSGGCIPLEYFSTPVDYESLNSIGAIMGSGGMVVMDQDNCMVDVARYFLEFNAGESCGKCTPCREGLAQALAILTRITRGQGTIADLAMLELLGGVIKDSSLCALGQTAPNPVTTTLKYFRHEYEEHIREKRCHAGTCESLFPALCENSCPLHMDIPGYIELIKEERWEDAFELTLRDNPLPGTLGRICHFHCQMRCRREMLDQPVSQGEIHRYLADTIYQLGKEEDIYRKLIKEKLPPTGKRVAIVGAGPAGLTAAFYLVRLGHDVTVYDAMPEAGGILRYGIPQYRLPQELLQKEIKMIGRLGVKFKMNRRLGGNLSLDELKKESDAIFLAIGAWKDVALNIPGEHAKGVFAGSMLLTGDGRIAVDRFTFRTSDPTIYAGGDAVSGPATAAEAMGMAKRAVAAIDRVLMNRERFHLLSREFHYGNEVPKNPKASPKNVARRLSVRDRVNNFNEISFGFTGEQARNEVERCLRCDVRCQ